MTGIDPCLVVACAPTQTTTGIGPASWTATPDAGSAEHPLLLRQRELLENAVEGVVHGAQNAGSENLEFIVLAIPPDIPR